jgi:hypothetical protein
MDEVDPKIVVHEAPLLVAAVVEAVLFDDRDACGRRAVCPAVAELPPEPQPARIIPASTASDAIHRADRPGLRRRRDGTHLPPHELVACVGFALVASPGCGALHAMRRNTLESDTACAPGLVSSIFMFSVRIFGATSQD